jgi:hypothetical protein
MKNLKNYCILTFIVLSISTFFYACSEETSLEPANVSKIEAKTSKRLASTICDISGSLSVVNGQYTYTYSNNTGNTIINWIATPSTGVSIANNGTNSVVVTFATGFSLCTLKASGTGGVDGCEKTITITRNTSGGTSGNGGDCACPNPVIRTNVTNNFAPITNTHPYYRLELQNLESGDTYAWSGMNAQFMAGVNGTYVIIKPLVPVNGIFEVYCTVTRVCPNGSIKKRKALYRNFLGGTQSTAYTAFLNIGNVCDTSVSGGGSNTTGLE